MKKILNHDANHHQTVDLSNVRLLIEEAKALAQKSNRQRNLELLWSVLESIRAEGSRNFCIAEVGRRMESAGGMRTQSLRNGGAEDFRRIIAEYENAVRIKGVNQIASNTDSAKRALEMILDPPAKAVLEGYVREARRLRDENNMLREAFKKVQLPEVIAEEPRRQQNSEMLHIEPELLGILRKSLNSKAIKRWGVIRDDGSIWDISGCELFPKRFLEAVEAAIKSLSQVD